MTLVTDRRTAMAYRARLFKAETEADNMGLRDDAAAFEMEREVLEHHVWGAMGVKLDELEPSLRIEPPFDPLYPNLIRYL